ncbi:hypothetical protein [Deinococcus roseus]|uniref:tRNA-guanine(15) transglycosylase-like domain-containing protein n=1 Tax=Deinococcus roseus TaxID=392414 RepID=A0ABQ2D996_9DEIO|nr:hypothetical protein [Deinococcus roseus]GGJ47893.1 hypothetical protein GCM10008938_37360 [Deinococcus roseus]
MKFIPVTTFGPRYPLDDLIRPYLPRLVDTVMVSYQYALQMSPEKRPPLALMVDSGGFVSRRSDARLIPMHDRAAIQVGSELLTPEEVLSFQEAHADTAFTLDFMLTPELSARERRKRCEWTVTNAVWAKQNQQHSSMKLYASLQACCAHTAREAAKTYRDAGFDGIGVGGLVPRLNDKTELRTLLEPVLEEAGDLPVHAFGLGSPKLLLLLQEIGVHSADSSSFVQWAASGENWQGKVPQGHLSPHGRMHLALQNLQEVLLTLGDPAVQFCLRQTA